MDPESDREVYDENIVRDIECRGGGGGTNERGNKKMRDPSIDNIPGQYHRE